MERMNKMMELRQRAQDLYEAYRNEELNIKVANDNVSVINTICSDYEDKNKLEKNRGVLVKQVKNLKSNIKVDSKTNRTTKKGKGKKNNIDNNSLNLAVTKKSLKNIKNSVLCTPNKQERFKK